MKKIFAAAIVAATMTAAPAMAQEFTGPRVEARVGMDSAKLDANGGSASGLTYGVGVGYDFAVAERVRLGVEAAIDSSTTDKEFGGLLRADAKRDIEVGARLGYVLTPSTLLYAKGAYTNARVGYSIDTTSGKIGLGHQTGEGYRVGGGVEVALTDHLYTGAEYRYSDYGSGDRRNQALAKVGIRF